MRILIIEDNQTTAEYLSQGLRENYFVPEVAYNGEDGLFFASQHEYVAIILDVMLPIIDGWTLIKKIRHNNNSVPIIFLTAKDAVADRVKGLELGADDYLIKPFAFSELLARIRTLMRRKQPLSTHMLQVADLTLDIKAHSAIRNGQYLNLTAKEFMLLTLLVDKTGEVLSRTYIAEKVWDINFDSDTNAIDVAINRLREKIDKHFDKKLIHSVRGVGYVLEAR